MCFCTMLPHKPTSVIIKHNTLLRSTQGIVKNTQSILFWKPSKNSDMMLKTCKQYTGDSVLLNDESSCKHRQYVSQYRRRNIT